MLKAICKSIFCFILGFLILPSNQTYAQVLTQATFTNPNGTTSGLMSGGQAWSASVPGGCPGPVSVFSVQAQQFVVTLANGFNCVNCADASNNPPLNCGDNLNLISFGPIDISNRCKIGIATQITAAGSLECSSPGGPPVGSIAGGHDQVACYYSLDGGPDVLYGYMCGNVLIMPANTGNVLSGNSLSIKIYAGNQNPAETYRIDNVVVSYLPKTTPTFNQLGPYCVGDTPGTLSNNSIEGISGTWSPATINTASSSSVIHTFTPSDLICYNPTTMTVVVNAAASPTFTPTPSYCAGDPIPVLPTTSNNGYTGTWSPAIDNTTTTTYTFTPTPGLCASTTTLAITVNQPTIPTFTPPPSYCAGAVIPALPTTSLNGINGSWSPAIDNTMTTTYTFTPTPGLCASTTTLAITINQPTLPTFTPPPSYCAGTAIPALPTTSLNGINGTWRWCKSR